MDPLISPQVSWFPVYPLSCLSVFSIVMALVPLGRVEADLMIYRNAGLFANATSGRTTNVVNFDSTPVGTSLTNSNYQGMVFGANPNVQGNLIITTGAPAIAGGLKAFSGTNFLGSDAGELITLGTNQSFSFAFQSPVSAVGLYFISESSLASGELGIRIGAGAGATSAVIDPLNGNEIALAGGTATNSFAYFVGIVDTNTLGVLPSITVFPGSTTAAPFGIDNITSTVTAVPEPSSLFILALVATAGLGTRAMRGSRKS